MYLMLQLKDNFSAVLIHKMHTISFPYNEIHVWNKDAISMFLKNNSKIKYRN
jgi:hypothetical protein